MSDLREAIVSEDWDVKGSNAILPWRDLVVLIAAARRFLALTETGPDYEAAYREIAVAWNKNTVTHQVMFDAAVAAVDAALADYLTEEETNGR